MLNLSRKAGEAFELTLGDGRTVVVQIKKITDSSVILGIDAPQSVRIGYKHLGGRQRQPTPLAQDRADQRSDPDNAQHAAS